MSRFSPTATRYYLPGDRDIERDSSKPCGCEGRRRSLFRQFIVAVVPQDVLLVGHASRNTGLGRNFDDAEDALDAAGAVVTGIDFEANAET